MQRKEMHPLCCISIDCPGIGDRSPELVERETASEERGGPEGNAGGEGESDGSVAGVLYKWTNFGKGWRSRWFTLRNGVLAYSKIRRREERFYVGGHVRVIGAASARLSRAMEDGAEGRRPKNPVGVVYLKESKRKRRIEHDRDRDETLRSYQKGWSPLGYMATQRSVPSQGLLRASEALLRPVPFLVSLRY